MKAYRPFFLLFLSCMFLAKSTAQELNCTILIDDKQVQTQEKQVIEDLKESISRFMNTTQWTEDIFNEEERIQCNILITLGRSTTITQYQAQVQVQSLRPVYGSNYETSVLTFFDEKWNFEYSISQPLIFSENTFSTELTSLLAYYAYTIIAMDYNTFSKEGSEIYYKKMLNILNNAQESDNPGWNAFGDTRDRYWIATHLNDPRFASFKEALYLYHRQGIDLMEKSPKQARENILEALKKIRKAQEQVQISVLINAFFDAKRAELINVFLRARPALRQEALAILSQLDPTQAGKYRKLAK